jgi:O-antigen/teichoic acid export membrane protein
MIAGSVLGYLALWFVLRNMTPVEYGTVASGMAYVGLFAFITDLGFNAAHVKMISEGRDLEKCVGTFFVIKIVLTGIMTGCVLISIFLWKFVVGKGFETPELESVIYLFILYYFILGMSAVPLATFAARRETAKQQLPGLLEPVTRAPLAIIIALGSLGTIALAGSYVIGVFALLIVAIILFRSYPFGKFDSELLRRYFSFAIPLAMSSGIVMISANIDKAMLQLFWGSRFVGYYFGVQRVTMFLILMSTAVTMLLFPTLSEHHGKNEYGHIRRLTTAAERYVSLVVMPSAILLIVFSRPILNIFSAEIAENAASVLQIMAIYSLVFCFYAIFLNQIMGVDEPKLGAKVGISMALINISLNMILIPKDIRALGINLFGMGAEGAALATAISAACGLIMVKVITRRLTGTKWNPRILLHLGAGIVMGSVLYYLNIIVTIDRWYEVGGACLLGMGIYFAILWLLREFKKKDLMLFLDILNPKGMTSYISSELRNNEKKR